VDALLEAVRQAAAPWGLNLLAAVPVERYVATAGSAPIIATAWTAQSIIVIANGGGAFWRAFRAHAAAHPGWDRRANPLDDFTRLIVAERLVPLAQAAGASCTPVFPFVNGSATLNFMALGKLTGLAGPSLLGVVVNPIYGPWIAFRAALLIDQIIDAPGDALGFDPCPRCGPRSCIAACPTGAIGYTTGWDIPSCVAYRVENEADCAPRCHARAGCVIGPEHRYPEDELAYHQKRALAAMRPHYAAHPTRRDS
jgi:hypothetical protein